MDFNKGSIKRQCVDWHNKWYFPCSQFGIEYEGCDYCNVYRNKFIWRIKWLGLEIIKLLKKTKR
jgi:hypothetical protein